MAAPVKTSQDLDEIDISILQILEADGRITMRELAQRINLSPPAATERVRRLEDAGFISGYRALLSPARLGLGVHAYIIVDNLPPSRRRQFLIDLLQNEPIVLSVEQLMSGGKEVILNIYCSELAELQSLHNRLVEAIGSAFTTLICDTDKYKDSGLSSGLQK